MKGFSHASQAAPAPPPRLCEVCGDMMRIRSITFAPKGSEVTYRCRQCETVALEFAPRIERDSERPSRRPGDSSPSCPGGIPAN